MVPSKSAKFPVFFPVSRELRGREVRAGLRPPPASLDIPLYSFHFVRNRYFAGPIGRKSLEPSLCLRSHSANALNWRRFSPGQMRRLPFAGRRLLPKNLILGLDASLILCVTKLKVWSSHKQLFLGGVLIRAKIEATYYLLR